MLKDRIIEIGDERILLPERCETSAGTLGWNDVKRIIASNRHSILITGETGTGKEAFAKCVEAAAQGQKFESINCAGLDPNLVGSEMFGHVEGAFTGAVRTRKGLLRSCDGGILFLDEIGWLPSDLQAKLLRFMETGEIRPIGADSTDTKRANVRIIAATNQDVTQQEVIIQDLRHRFDFEIKLPSLNERGADVLWFLCNSRFIGSGRIYTGITLRTVLGMYGHWWRGNVRELLKYCERKEFFNEGVLMAKTTERLAADGEQSKTGVGSKETFDANILSFGMVMHIFDDSTLAGNDTIKSQVEYAGFVLHAAEKKAKAESSYLTPEKLRVLQILVEMCAGLNETADRFDGVLAVIPLKTLRNELEAVPAYDLRHLSELLQETCPKVEWPEVKCMLYRLGRKEVGLGDAVRLLRGFAAEFSQLKNRHQELTLTVSSQNGRLEKANYYPTSEFVRHLRNQAADGRIFGIPEPPEHPTGLEALLDKYAIMGDDRLICQYCAQGMSSPEIARQPDIRVSKSKVTEILAEIRRKHGDLAPFIPPQSAGRKRTKMVSDD